MTWKCDKTYTWIFGLFAKWLEKTAYLESEMTNLKSFVLKLHTFILPYLMATLNFWPFSKCLGLFWYSYSVLLYCLRLQFNSVLYVFWICVFNLSKINFFLTSFNSVEFPDNLTLDSPFHKLTLSFFHTKNRLPVHLELLPRVYPLAN